VKEKKEIYTEILKIIEDQEEALDVLKDKTIELAEVIDYISGAAAAIREEIEGTEGFIKTPEKTYKGVN